MRSRENWYRDVWLFAISIFMALTLIIGLSQNSQRISDIASSRAYSIKLGCQQQNAHNIAAIQQLHHIIDEIPNNVNRKEAQRGEIATILMINALAPRQNCMMRVKKLTKAP